MMEASIALAATLLPAIEPVEYATIIPSTRSPLGRTVLKVGANTGGGRGCKCQSKHQTKARKQTSGAQAEATVASENAYGRGEEEEGRGGMGFGRLYLTGGDCRCCVRANPFHVCERVCACVRVCVCVCGCVWV